MIKLNIQRFGHTNQTTHYELPQFIGTDKPQWLTDINQAFSGIDSAIYDADAKGVQANNNIGTMSNLDTDVKSTLVSAINEVNTNADNNATNIGNMSNLTPSANNNLVEAINEVDSHADTNATNIGTMANLETTNKNNLVGAINEILGYFNLNETDIITDNDVTVTGGAMDSGTVKTAINNNGTLAKVYGYFAINKTADNLSISFPTSLRPKTDIVINMGCSFREEGTTNKTYFGDLQIKTTGVVEADWYTPFRGAVVFYGLPFLLFIKDFGDVPTPPAI